MADSEAKSKEGRTKKIKKRKLRSPEVTERPSKTLRVELSENQREQTEVERVENLEQSEPNQDILEQTWRNLQLILSIQNKELDLQKLVPFSFCLSFFSVVAVCLVSGKVRGKESNLELSVTFFVCKRVTS